MAMEDAEGSLQRQYKEATRSHTTTMYQKVLIGASRLGRNEFTAAQLRGKIKDVAKMEISQGALNNYLMRLVSDDYSRVLHRCGKGIYKFSDPRMPSFIRIANAGDFEDDSSTTDFTARTVSPN